MTFVDLVPESARTTVRGYTEAGASIGVFVDIGGDISTVLCSVHLNRKVPFFLFRPLNRAPLSFSPSFTSQSRAGYITP